MLSVVFYFYTRFMELTAAIELIQPAHFTGETTTVWADLGCGSGLFTVALAHCLQPGSTVFAVDQNPVRINVPPPPDRIITPLQLDFVTDALPFQQLNGILMANSLHYVQHKQTLLKKLSTCLLPDGRFLIVEYDTDKPVPQWVPYPVSFRSLQPLFAKAGYHSVEKLGERASVYGRAGMYAALVSV